MTYILIYKYILNTDYSQNVKMGRKIVSLILLKIK